MTAQTEHSVPWRPADTLAARLRAVRTELKLSQREAALRTGLTYGEWQSMENGAEARGIDRKVQAISAALNVDRDWLLWGAGQNYASNTQQYDCDSASDLHVPAQIVAA